MSIYLAARDLSGLPIGTHQFIIIQVTSNPHPAAILDGKAIYPKILSKNKMGYVIGAHNRGNLAVKFFEKSDYEAAREYFEPSRIKWYSPDFDTQVIQVNFGSLNKDVAIRKIFELIDIYNINLTMDEIPYPTAGFGYNSNSWAQSVIEYAGGTVKSNMSGFDISHQKRIPKIYFNPVCLNKPRPKLN